MALELIYILFVIADYAVMLFYALKKKQHHKKIARIFNKLIIILSIMIFSSTFAMVLPFKEVALFFETIHYMSTEWILIYLLLFLEYYIGHTTATMRTRLPFMIYAAISNCSLFCNFIFHHVVDCERIVLNGTEHINKFYTKAPFYETHLYFCCVLMLIIIVVMAEAWLRSPKIYKKKYSWGLVIILLTVTLEVICNLKEFVHDFALFGYIDFAFLLCYFTYHYFPKDVMNKMLIYMVGDSKNGALCFDANDNCIYANDVVRSFYNEEMILEDFEARYKKILGVDRFQDATEQTFLKEFDNQGTARYVEVSFSKLYDDRGLYMGSYISGYDKTNDINEIKEQQYRATHDPLTGLFNAEHFSEQVMEFKNTNTDTTYYLVYIDINDFKLVNSLFGYEAGNDILCQLATFLKNSLPDDSIATRLGSDHFAICIPKKHFSEKHLLQCLNDAQNQHNTSEFQLHIHAGIYEIQPSDEDVSVMCDYAKMALQTVKNDYNKLYAFHNEILMDKLVKNRQMIDEFETAIENQQFVMYLQPQMDTNGNVMGAEALVRWLHPEKGLIMPGEFIPVFENAGLIYKLDMCMWEQAAKKLKQWKDKGNTKTHISVNISTKDFYYIDLYKTFTELVTKYDISPKQLKLEITETAFIQDVEKQLELIGKLQAFGFDMEIDDFGSGYSSLNMLKDWTADVLKIDMGFLREIESRKRTKVILGTIVDLAKRLNMTVITEGVETREQVDYLTSVGCDMFQGYYFAKPIPVEQFEKEYL